MSDSNREIRSRWGGPARLPLALSGLLAVVAAAMLALVLIGSGIDDPQIAQTQPGADQENQPPPQELAVATPPAVPEPAPSKAGPEPVISDPASASPSTDDEAASDSAVAGQAPAAAAPATPLEPALPPKLKSVDVSGPPDTGQPEAPQLAAVPPPLPPGAGVLPPAPDPGLIEQTSVGPLPRIGDDGRLPWRVYARPFDNRDRWRFRVIWTDHRS